MHYEYEPEYDADENQTRYERITVLDEGDFYCPRCGRPTEGIDGYTCETCGDTYCRSCLIEDWNLTGWGVCLNCHENGRAEAEFEDDIRSNEVAALQGVSND